MVKKTTQKLENGHQITSQHSVIKTIVLHLLPGIPVVLVFWLFAYIFSTRNIPSYFALLIAAFFVLLPLQMGILVYVGYKRNKKFSVSGVIQYRKKTPIWQIIVLSLIAIGWLAFIMGFVDAELKISDTIKEKLFFWLPDYFDLGSVYSDPTIYTKGLLISMWFIGLFLVGIIAPSMEEFYFRGYLLPNISQFRYWAPLINTVLFAVYHFWSPWLIPMRIIAVLPMIYFVWWKKDIKIGILSHVLINVVADSILTIPIIFG